MVLKGPGGPERLVVFRGPVPEPGPGQVLIRAQAAGVAFNDVTTRQGRNPGRLPRVIGFDVVGVVEQVGAGVTSVQVGDRVAALLGTGGYSTHVLTDAGRTVPVPAGLDAAEVDALVLNYLTAWQMLHRTAKVVAGQTILVLGAAGGVGSALCELAALDGVTVFGTSSAARRAAVDSGGARWVARPADLPVKVDAVFDPVGGPSLKTSRRATKRGGVVVSYGFSFTVAKESSRYGGLARTVAAILLAKVTPGPPVRVHGGDPAKKDPEAYRQDMGRLLQLLADGQIRPVVTRVALTDAVDAHRRLEARQVIGKLVLVPDHER